MYTKLPWTSWLATKLPAELVCPITQTCIQDPILTVQGNVYEHAAITLWLQTHDTDSLINASLKAPTLIPCNRIKSEIEAFKAEVRRLGAEAAAQPSYVNMLAATPSKLSLAKPALSTAQPQAAA